MILIPYNIKPSDSKKYYIIDANSNYKLESKKKTLTEAGSPQNAYFIKVEDMAGDNPDLLFFLSKQSTKVSIGNLPNQTHYLINSSVEIVFLEDIQKFAKELGFGNLLNSNSKLVIGIENGDNQIKIQKSAYGLLHDQFNDNSFAWFFKLYESNTLGSYFEIKIDEINNKIYINYIDSKSSFISNSINSSESVEIEKSPSILRNNIKGKNIIYYGVPGNGKSQTVQREIGSKVHERILFHPDYSYADFIGQIVPSKDVNGNPTYEYKPGVFTLILEQALAKNEVEHYLIIEEINRGNASAIFGDIFQLLDRDELGSSRFKITNSLISKYLFDKGLLNDEKDKVFIPNNLFIYGTMNTSDQNVFQLDTSFKRRWEFRFVKNDIKICPYNNMFVPNSSITWERFHFYINKKISERQGDISSFDDKQIGPFFISSDFLSKNSNDFDQTKNSNFSHKILEYLWNDVAKLSRDLWFKNINSLENLIDTYINNGLASIFEDL